jgi:hypothetical protein
MWRARLDSVVNKRTRHALPKHQILHATVLPR